MTRPQPATVVVGSVNMDLVVTAPAIPTPGQTLLAHGFSTVPGGKGANQAVAAARLGSSTALIGRVGDDAFGAALRRELEESGVDCRHLQVTPGAPSGVALIVVSDTGENAICVVAGANALLTPEDVEAAEPLIAAARVCVLQLEIPLPTAARAAACARRHGVEVVLDPAPAPGALPAELWAADILTPNQSEAARLLGSPRPPEDPAETARQLQARGARSVVLKLGASGAYFRSAAGAGHLPGHRVRVVDTTAAGDAFTAALAVGRAEGRPLPEAVALANAAGALACTRFGAQPSAPRRAEVERLLAGAGPPCG